MSWRESAEMRGYDVGYLDAIKHITEWIEKEWQLFGPDTDCGGTPCEHGIYDWESCQACTVNQIIEGIRDGSFANER